MERRSIIFVLILVFFSIQGTVIGQRVTISKMNDLIGAEKGIVSKYLNSQEYFFKRSESGFEIFARNNDNGYNELTVGFKNARLNVISWKESVLFSSKLMGEAMLAGFDVDQNKSVSQVMVLVNSSKGQILTLFDYSREGYILVNLGRTEKDKGSTQKLSISENLKYYCEGTETWVYSLRLDGQKAYLELYPGLENSLYKKGVKPSKVMVGTFKDGVIKVLSKDGKITFLFKIENGVLSQLNNEGGYSDYFECTYYRELD
jgi:hypothetical protein